MLKSFSRKIKYMIVGAFALMLSITALIVGMPNAKAYTDVSTITLENIKSVFPEYEDEDPDRAGYSKYYDNKKWSISGFIKKNDTIESCLPEEGPGCGSRDIWYDKDFGPVITAVSYNVSFNTTCDLEILAWVDGNAVVYDCGSGSSSNGLVILNEGTTSVIFRINNYEKFAINSLTVTVKSGSATSPVTISAGTGVKSVYLSTSSSATSGSASGTEFDDGLTVHGFAELDKGYKAKSGWTRVYGTDDTEGAKYYVGSVSAGSSNFGTISAGDLIIYNIAYNLGGGTHGATHPSTYNVTTNSFTISNPTKTGYTFSGWSGTGISGTSTSVTVAKGSIGDRTYTANWTANTYTVKYNGNKPSGASGNVTNIPGNATWTYDSNATLGAAPTLAGYTFNGWYQEAACTTKLGNAGQTLTKPNLTSTQGATVNLYAKWTANTYTVTLDNNRGTGGTDSVTATYDANMPNAEMPTRFGCEFLGYFEYKNDGTQYYNADGTSKRTWNKASNATLFANWKYDSNAQEVVDKINAIGGIANVSYPTSKEAIIAAEEAYAALLLINAEYANTLSEEYTLLTQEREKFDSLREAAINNVNTLIDALETITYPDSLNDIKAAEEAYANLDNADKNKNIIPNYERILVKARTDYDSVDAVVNEINDIPAFAYNDPFKEILDHARSSYNNLTYDQKAIFPQDVLDKLIEDENQYAAFDTITNIGKIENTKESRNRVKKAKAAYDALTLEQKELLEDKKEIILNAVAVFEVIDMVNNAQKAGYTTKDKDYIDKTREAYEALTDPQKEIFPEDTLAMLVNIEKAYIVMVIINQIGGLEYTDQYKAKIDNARSKYDALTDPQKELVKNYVVLSVDEQSYTRVDEAVKAIDNIKKIKYNTSTKEKIEGARKAYNKLDKEERTFVNNSEKLLQAENKYEVVKHNHKVAMGWVASLSIIFGIFALLAVVYVILFFLCNKWIIIDNKPSRVLVLKKGEKVTRVLKMNLLTTYRAESEIYNTKEEAMQMVK